MLETRRAATGSKKKQRPGNANARMAAQAPSRLNLDGDEAFNEADSPEVYDASDFVSPIDPNYQQRLLMHPDIEQSLLN